MSVGKVVQYFDERVGRSNEVVKACTIDTVSNVSQCVANAHEYVCPRRLIFDHVISIR